MDAGRERHNEYSIRARVTVPRIERDDYHGAFAFFRRIDRKLNKPNLTAKGKSPGLPRHADAILAPKLA